MKRLLSTDYSVTSFNLATLILRCTFGFLLLFNHGIPKLMKFAQMQSSFFDPFGIGSRWALILVIFAEVFCTILVVLGLFTRFAVIPLIIMFCVIIFMAHKGDPLSKLEPAFLFLAAFLTIFFVGPGRLSVDGIIGR
jgi:putative oxidoreductase